MEPKIKSSEVGGIMESGRASSSNIGVVKGRFLMTFLVVGVLFNPLLRGVVFILLICSMIILWRWVNRT